jgi:hypothetical protein
MKRLDHDHSVCSPEDPHCQLAMEFILGIQLQATRSSKLIDETKALGAEILELNAVVRSALIQPLKDGKLAVLEKLLELNELFRSALIQSPEKYRFRSDE